MKRNDKNIIIKSFASFSSNDFVLATLFYGPLLDSDAFKLYITLVSLTRKNNINKSFKEVDLLDLVSLSYNKYLLSRSKLEALDLLLTYESDQEFLFLLHKPQSPNQFLKSGVLGKYLNNKIGEGNLKRIIEIFKNETIDITKFKNVSASFDSVFGDIDLSKDFNISESLEVDVVSKNVNKSLDTFDFNEFSKNVNLSFIPPQELDNFKQKLVNDAYMYSLDMSDLIVAYNKATAYDSFNLKTYKEYIKKIYNENNSKKVLVTKKINNDELYDELSLLSTDELLSYASLDSNASNIDKLSEIYNTINLDRPCLNLIILFVAREKKELPSVNYFVSVYNTLVEKGILSFNQIKEYFYSDKTKVNKKTNKKQAKTNDDWVDKNMNDFLGGLTNE